MNYEKIGTQKSSKNLPLINPLTTKAESYSDLPEIFTTDSSNFLKNKMFCMNFFLQGLPRYKKFSFFLIFNSVDLFFIKNI